MAGGDNTPIIVGAGQYVEREATLNSPMHLASEAAGAAIADCGGKNIAAAIDTIAVVKLFSDSTPMWACPFGRSDNPPESIAQAIGAAPAHRIYSQTGGNQPQSLLIEMARAIARGEKSMALLAGAEAIRNQRNAQRHDLEPDWNESFDLDVEDRGFGEMVATNQERKNGMVAPMYYYILIEQARRHRLGLSVDDYRAQMAQLMASFSQVAANNPFAQFEGAQSAEDILGAAPLTHLYSKRMIAQDSVNQAAALLVCSIGKARELGIPEERWIYLHGMAEGSEVDLSERADPSTSSMAGMVADRALDMADVSVADIDLIDIYSCFPCAVTAIADHLGLPDDGSQALTLTGGLPYFGGPGNNYSMHGLAEMVRQLHGKPEAYGLVTTNGGVLSKHASGVYSRKASAIGWAEADTYVSNDSLERKPIIADPGTGTVISYTVNFLAVDAAQAIVIAETEDGGRFAACTGPEDSETVQACLAADPTGRLITVSPPQDHTLHFHFAESA